MTESVRPMSDERLPDEATLTVNILRTWSREQIERFALHLLGDEWQGLRASLQEKDSDIAGYFRIRDGHLKQIADLEAEVSRLRQQLSAPFISDFLEGVRIEAAHQCERWGVDSDAGKTASDWFWLIGYLAGKALASALRGDTEKALHHTISTAAVCLNWHGHITGERTKMRPGIEPPLERQRGTSEVSQ